MQDYSGKRFIQSTAKFLVVTRCARVKKKKARSFKRYDSQNGMTIISRYSVTRLERWVKRELGNITVFFFYYIPIPIYH